MKMFMVFMLACAAGVVLITADVYINKRLFGISRNERIALRERVMAARGGGG